MKFIQKKTIDGGSILKPAFTVTFWEGRVLMTSSVHDSYESAIADAEYGLQLVDEYRAEISYQDEYGVEIVEDV